MIPVLAADDVHRRFPGGAGVAGVSLALAPGASLGLVGFSGCGKSTLLRLLLRLLPVEGGRILVDGADVTRAEGRALAPLRRAAQLVMQSPHAALDPRMTIGASLEEPLRAQTMPRAARRARAAAVLEEVGLGERFLRRYPHEMSGGQKQRACIARALAPRPRALLLDEPTSALDVSVQAQIIALLADLRARHGLAMLFVSHDLAVVRLLCDEVAVMAAGRIVEHGATASVLSAPDHPVTRQLLDAVLPIAAAA